VSIAPRRTRDPPARDHPHPDPTATVGVSARTFLGRRRSALWTFTAAALALHNQRDIDLSSLLNEDVPLVVELRDGGP